MRRSVSQTRVGAWPQGIAGGGSRTQSTPSPARSSIPRATSTNGAARGTRRCSRPTRRPVADSYRSTSLGWHAGSRARGARSAYLTSSPQGDADRSCALEHNCTGGRTSAAAPQGHGNFYDVKMKMSCLRHLMVRPPVERHGTGRPAPAHVGCPGAGRLVTTRAGGP